MPPEPVSGDTWRWMGRVIDLNDPEGTYPPNIRATILATRDASTPEDEDLAAWLAWITEEHPPWDFGTEGGCHACGTTTWCAEQDRAHHLATRWLTEKAWQLVQRSRQRLAEFDQRRKAERTTS
ncbi:hypothetical protein DMH04_41405 [Kibdelosporangium aridum]|uniref:Uncharacterized protein n=1 Tax=Kibdelosporangium aridum TaxID=2030 RepID=A0A428YV10_KIBAR|nr:hypothetical protein [Kibdelosporangium aridum]RSM73471.1 hypothetical protein DMH04_41405 [Kibdelosporangium aridum]